MASHPVLVFMGPAGTGKSTVASMLAGRLGWDFQEGDDLHPEANVAKMASGHALNDHDRWPWLDRVAAWIDGRIAADKLTVLTDPRHAIPGYDAILMVAPARANDARFTAALRPLGGRIPVEAMRTANYQVDRDTDKQTPEAAARWLASKIGLPSS